MSAGRNVIEPCPDHPDGGVIMVESGYTRIWRVTRDDDGTVTAYDDRFDVESGAGDDYFECATCLRTLPDNVDHADLNYS